MTVDSLVATTTQQTHPVAPAGKASPARRRHPVAHWVTMTGDDGRDRLTCVWETPGR